MNRKKPIPVTVNDTIFPLVGRAEDEEGRQFRTKGLLPGTVAEVVGGKGRGGKKAAIVLRVVKESPLVTEKGCIHRGECGGCAYQGVDADVETASKKREIDGLFHAEGIDLPPWTMHRAPAFTAYRNKMEYTFGNAEKDGPLTLGLHRKGRHHDIITTPGCTIVHRDMLTLQQTLVDFCRADGGDFYHRMTGKGFYRHAVMRRSETNGDLLLNLVTTSARALPSERLLAHLNKAPLEGRLRGVIHTENDSPADAVIPEKVRVIDGEDLLEETLLGIDFRLSAYAFFQTNTKGAAALYAGALAMMGKKKRRLALDLYSGTGTLAQLMAPLADEVIGVEIVADAVEKARESAVRNNLGHVKFIEGDVKDVVESLEERADLAVVDPPREGLNPKAAGWLARSGIPEILMISCNPKTMARDLAVMIAAGYRLEKFAGYNQFPRTAHAECVCLMTRAR